MPPSAGNLRRPSRAYDHTICTGLGSSTSEVTVRGSMPPAPVYTTAATIEMTAM